MTHSTRRLATLAVVTAGAVAAPVASAQAATISVGDGATAVRLSPQTKRALSSLGVRVTPTSPARTRSGTVAFPVTGGSIDPVTGAGTITHAGGLRFAKGSTRVTLSSFRVRTSGPRTVSVRVNGGSRLTAFRVELGAARVARSGLGTAISGVNLVLTRQGARALNRSFGVSNFRTGRLGSLATVALPTNAVLTGGSTAIAFTPTATQALTTLGITPGILDGAGVRPEGALAFPITAGTLRLTSGIGTVAHRGTLTLARGETVVTLSSFVIDTRARTLSGSINGGPPTPILSLDLSAVPVRVRTGTFSIGGVDATLTPAAAAALNAAFGTTAFTPGLAFATASIDGQVA